MGTRIVWTGVVLGLLANNLSPTNAQAPVTSGAARATAVQPARTLDGQPDVQGFWRTRGGITNYDLESPERGREHYQLQGSDRADTNRRRLIIDPPNGQLPMLPWAREKRTEILEHHTNPTILQLDPLAQCHLNGPIRSMYHAEVQIIQGPRYVLLLHGWTHAYRYIPLDGSPHPGEGVKLWMGDSRGHWEGNTLVVDVKNTNDHTWFDVVGTFHSDAMHVVERITVVDSDSLSYEARIDDPKVYSRPWTIAFPMERMAQKGYELLEDACYEGLTQTNGVEHLIGRSK